MLLDGTYGLNGSTVENNTATLSGGGMYTTSEILSITNDSLLQNNTASAGGGISASGVDTTVVVRNSQLVGNQATAQGGGIFQDSGVLSVRVSRLEANTAGTGGGALSLVGDASATVASSVSSENISAQHRVLYESSEDLFIQDSVLGLNEAGAEGGAIANNAAGTLTLLNSPVEGNTSQKEGGGLFASNNTATVIEGLRNFSDNEAVEGGGGISLNGADSSLSVEATRFMGNASDSDGGAIRNVDAALNITNATFADNTAMGDGGALYLAGNSDSTVSNSTSILNNRAESGGGISAVDTATLTIEDATVEGNRAYYAGGGLHLADNSQTVVHGSLSTDADGRAVTATTRLENNSADPDVRGPIALENGGAIAATDDAHLTLDSVLIAGNTAHRFGGGVAVLDRSQTIVTNSNFEDNVAITSGGGFYRNNTDDSLATTVESVTVADSRFIGNEATFVGGGFAYDSGPGRSVIERSLFLENRASSGAGLFTGADLSLSDSNVTQNIASSKGGGALLAFEGNLQASATTFEGNEAAFGGGISSRGTTELTNSTLSGNQASNDGGGIHTDGSVANLTIRSSTLTNNTADGVGGGIVETNSQAARLLNSIVAENMSAAGTDVSGEFIDEGNNLIGISDGATGFTNSVLVGTAANPIDSGLEPLADNGGPTATHAPLVISVAVDAGSDVNLPAVDQRGVLRVAGSAVDIGSVELPDTELEPTIPVDPVEPTVLVDPAVSDPVEPTVPVDPADPDPVEPAVPVVVPVPGLLEPTASTTDSSALDRLLAVRKRYDLADADASIRRLEQSFSRGFEDYWDLSAGPDFTFSEVQAILRRAQDEYKVNSAVVYAIFVPEEPSETGEDAILQVAPTSADDDLLNLSVVMPEGDLVSYQLPVTRQEAARQVRYFRSAVSDPEDPSGYQSLSQQLYQWLLAPIEEDLAAQNVHNLMYALDAGLRTAPIAAMRDYYGFSLERYGISVVPSMSLMQADFPVPVRRSTVAMGVSEFASESPLLAVPIELQVVDQFVPVSQTVLNEFTTLDAIKSVQSLEQPGILHLATHASFDRRSPEESYIHLWDESLSMRDFSQLDWEKSDLEMLILSACSTALGSRNSELGFAGLAAASGVDATVGSLWEVSDVGTLALMSEFYAQLEATDLRFEALRQAQLALLKGETRIEGGNLITGHGEVKLPEEWDLPESATLDHPFFWSAFTMVGNPW